MKQIKKEDIIKIYEQEKSFLKDGIKNGKNPYHIFTLSTINNDFADSRMVVLRNIKLLPLKIYFNIDSRSPKAKQLAMKNDCTALFYDSKRRVQIRCKCTADIHNNNSISKDIWDKTAQQSRKCYMGPYEPSIKLDSWHPNIPEKYLDKDPEVQDSEQGYKNFSHIELTIIELDILQLHYSGHIRFKVNNQDQINFISP